MAVSDIEAVLEFLRKNGFSESESALMEDVVEKSEFKSFAFEKFLFPVVPPPRPLKIPDSRRRSAADAGGDGVDSDDDSSEEFVSLGSSTTDVCSSEFTNPYGIPTTTRLSSQASSDIMSQFGTARDYDFDMQNDVDWYNEKDEDYTSPPQFDRSDSFICPSEDKFITTSGMDSQMDGHLDLNHMSEELQFVDRSNYLEKPWNFDVSSVHDAKGGQITDYHPLEENFQREGSLEKGKLGPISENFAETRIFAQDFADSSLMNVNNADVEDIKRKRSSTYNWDEEFKSPADLHNTIADKVFVPNGNVNHGCGNGRDLSGDPYEPFSGADEEDAASADELLLYDTNEDEYEVFNLRIIHRKNRTGFEENKELPIVLNGIIAGRYYVTEYLGSAAFSRVVQAQDMLTGIDVCLKIIKNDKDFFDQSLDEIKLLKFVNKHDPTDERHILRLYDYFYYQEHLFIVCELLRANLYEFQKYNQESGGEPYFTLSRLQLITRQCLEALEFLHHLGIIHCDLKPENILIKSYGRCAIKVIDLGSSCFQTDNLCLYVQSRSYRAPEVILGLPYDQKIDLWSLGCILAELWCGEVLFPNDALVMLLARMIGLLGPIDMEMLVRGQETHKYFTEDYDLFLINEETNQLEYVIPEESSLQHHLQVSDVGFIDFLRDLLEINPQRRPTAREALEHPWLSHQYELNSY